MRLEGDIKNYILKAASYRCCRIFNKMWDDSEQNNKEYEGYESDLEEYFKFDRISKAEELELSAAVDLAQEILES